MYKVFKYLLYADTIKCVAMYFSFNTYNAQYISRAHVCKHTATEQDELMLINMTPCYVWNVWS